MFRVLKRTFSQEPGSLLAVALVACCLMVPGRAGLAQPAAAPSTVPDTLANRDPGARGPLWISARAAATPEGELRWQAFGEADRELLRNEVENLDEDLRKMAAASELRPAMERAPYLSEALCSGSSVIFSHREDDRPRDTWEDLRRYARAIFSGRVVAIEQGFQGGLPLSLVEVEVDDVVRLSDDYAAARTLYLAYPYAAFAVGDKVFCRDHPRFSYRPQIGDRLLLFPSHLPRDEHARMLDLEPTEIFAQKPSGELFVPERLRNQEALRDLDDLERLLHRLTLEEHRRSVTGKEGGR